MLSLPLRSAGLFERIVKGIADVLGNIGVVLLGVLMLLGAADVIGRYLFNKPIIGTMEIGEILLASMVVLGWSSTQFAKEHVSVEFFVSRVPRRARLRLNFATTFLSLVLFGLITWQSVVAAKVYHEAGRLVYTINLPLAPFQLVVSLGALILCAVFIIQMVQLFRQMKGGA